MKETNQAVAFTNAEFWKVLDMIFEEAVSFNIGMMAAGRQRLYIKMRMSYLFSSFFRAC
jgi:hypothetical protein